MDMHRSIRLPLAGAVAAALFGAVSVASAQLPPQQPMPPPPPQQPMPPPPPQQPMPPPPPQQPMPPPPPQQPMPPTHPLPRATQPPPGSAAVQLEPGTVSQATYPTQDGTLTVRSGMSTGIWQQSGPPPAFSSLDTNKDGHISQQEAEAYPPLSSDFLYASSGRPTVSHARYENWVKTAW